jgi:prevent-host-death family protein
MYNVQMKRYSVTTARQRISDLLNAAEAGESVVIERRGVQFRLVAVRSAEHPRRRNLVLEMDPAVEEGRFTWEAGESGLSFSRREPSS